MKESWDPSWSATLDLQPSAEERVTPTGKVQGAPSPYPGPVPFEQKDHPRFFGRELELVELESLVGVNRCVLLYAESGAGKTSLLNAGLIPKLRTSQPRYEIPNVARVTVDMGANAEVPRRPANIFIYQALTRLSPEWTPDATWLDRTLAEHLRQMSQRDLESPSRPPDDPKGRAPYRLIVFDQFEEFFTSHPERRAERFQFFRQVSEALVGSPDFVRRCDLVSANGAWLTDPAERGSAIVRGALEAGFGDIESFADGDSTKRILHGINDLLQEGTLIQTCRLGDEWTRARLADAEADLKAAGYEPSPATEERLARYLLTRLLPGVFAPVVEGDPRLRVVFSMREDYIGQVEPFIEELPDGVLARYRIEPLEREASLEAIHGPLTIANEVRFEDGVAERLVDDLLADDAEGLHIPRGPSDNVDLLQLQIVCGRLYDELPIGEAWITKAHLAEFGKVEEALRAFFEDRLRRSREAYRRQLTDDAKPEVAEGDLRRWFAAHLINRDGQRTRVHRGEAETAGLPNALVELLHEYRLLRMERHGGSISYELPHDRFRSIVRSSNQAWLTRFHDLESQRAELEEQARRWRDEDGPTLDAVGTAVAEAWQAKASADFGVGPLLRSFIASSRSRVDQHQREAEFLAEIERKRADDAVKETKRLRKMLVGMALLACTTVGFAFIAREESRKAYGNALVAQRNAGNEKEARRHAEESKRKAEQKEKVASEALNRARAAEADAERQRDLADRAALDARVKERIAREQSVRATRLKQIADSERARAVLARSDEAKQREIAVEAARKAKQAETTATQRANEAVAARKALADANKELEKQAAAAVEARGSAEKARDEATAARDEAIAEKVKALIARQEAETAKRDAEAARLKAVEEEGKARFALAEADLKAESLLAAVTVIHNQIARQPEPPLVAQLAAQAAQAGSLKQGGDVGTAIRRPLDPFQRTFRKPFGNVDLYTASQNGGTYATADGDRRRSSVQILDARGKKKGPGLNMDGEANALRLSADGRLVAVTGPRESKVWDTTDFKKLVTLDDAPQDFVAVDSVAKLVAFGSQDGQLWICSVGTDTPPRVEKLRESITSLEILNQGSAPSRVLVGLGMGEVLTFVVSRESVGDALRVHREMEDSKTTPFEKPHRGPVSAIAASAGASGLYATGGYDQKVILWDPASRSKVALPDLGSPVRSLAFSSDGRYLTGVGFDGSVAVFDVPSRALLGVANISLFNDSSSSSQRKGG